MLARRYQPSWPPGEAAWIGLDFSDVIPPGIGLVTGTLEIVVNRSPTVPQADFTQGPVVIDGRRVWSQITGGALGVDYQVRWTVGDTRQQTWQRTALLLCAETS